MAKTCPKCLAPLIAPQIVKGAKAAIVGEFPGKEEIAEGKVFVGATGDILRRELRLKGINPLDLTLTNLWQHEAADCPEWEDIQWNIQEMIRQVQGVPLLLLCGSECSQALFQTGVSDLSGLWMTHKQLPKTRIMVAPNPASLFHQPVGEWRLALDRFTSAYNPGGRK